MSTCKVEKGEGKGKARRQRGGEAGLLGAIKIAWLNHYNYMTTSNQKEIYAATEKEEKKNHYFIYMCKREYVNERKRNKRRVVYIWVLENIIDHE